MCIIIQGKPKDITKKYLKNAFRNNPHGFGVMYLLNGQVIQEKIYPQSFKDIRKLFKKHRNKTDNIGLHFRYCTVGKKTAYNSHPYNVLNKEHKYQMAFMHNSPELPHVAENENRSDSYFFVKQFFTPIISRDISLIKNDDFLKTLEEIINLKCDSRVLILDNFKKEFTRVGTWVEQDNLFLSNTYGIREPIYYSYSTISKKTEPSSTLKASDISIQEPLKEVEKTEFAGRQTYEVSKFSTYKDTNRDKIEKEINHVYSVLQSGNKAEYLKLMTENTGALATVLKDLFHDVNYDSWDNYNDRNEYYQSEIDQINSDTIKKHG